MRRLGPAVMMLSTANAASHLPAWAARAVHGLRVVAYGERCGKAQGGWLRRPSCGAENRSGLQPRAYSRASSTGLAQLVWA